MTADLIDLAATNRQVAKELAAGERERLAAAQRTADADAAAERRLREAEGQLHLTGKRDEVKAARRQRRLAEREAKRLARRARRAGWWLARRTQAAAAVGYVRGNAASVYSSVIYGLAVAGAVYGQIDAARLHDFPMLLAVSASVAIEGTGLAMALTAQQQRLSRERALAARLLVWICTALAVTINYGGHVESNPAKAYVLSALSALGIVVFEIRSGARHRATLRRLGMIAEPGEQFGAARWLAFPAETFRAWKLGVRDRLSPGAAKLIARVELAAADRRRQARVAEVAALARRAARRAARKGEAGPALAALVRLSHTGTPAEAAEQHRLRAEAERRAAAAEAEAEALRSQVDRAEAEARTRAEAEAARRAEAKAEVTAATRRAEQEARARVEAEAEARAARERAEAEATRRAEAEAEARAARERAEAEVAQAARMRGQAEVAGRGAQSAQQQVVDEQQRRVTAEANARAAEQVLTEQRQRLAEVTEQLAQATAQVTELKAGRPRRAAPRAAAAAEPVLFHGQPVPVVPGVGTETVLKVLTVHEDRPDATQKDVAAEVQTSVRTVRAVLKVANDLVTADNNAEEATQ